MVVVEPALAMVAVEADTGVLPLFPVPALISEDVGVVAPVGRMTHRTFSANVMVKETTVDVPEKGRNRAKKEREMHRNAQSKNEKNKIPRLRSIQTQRTILLPVTVVAVGWTVKPDVNMSSLVLNAKLAVEQ